MAELAEKVLEAGRKGSIANIKAVAVYCGTQSSNNLAFDVAIVRLGKFMAEHGMTLVFGGIDEGPMKLLADTVMDAGGETIGVYEPGSPVDMSYKRASHLVVTYSPSERKSEMRLLADAIVALPGGLDTIDELMDSLVTRGADYDGHEKPVGVLNVNGYYDKFLEFVEHARKTGFMDDEAASMLQCGSTPEELFALMAEKLPPPVDGAGMPENDINALWRAMELNAGMHGRSCGAPFANAFYRRARHYPLASWRKASREIAYRMLMWVNTMDEGIYRSLDCSDFMEFEWQELLTINPQILRHPKFPWDSIHPLEILHVVNMDMRCLAYVDDKEFVRDLPYSYAKEDYWSKKDIETALQMGKPEFAAWLKVAINGRRYALRSRGRSGGRQDERRRKA